MYTILLIFIALVFPFVCKMIFPHKITWKEYLLHTGVSLFCAGATYFIINHAATYDVELWSGEVTKKYSERVSCEHSYQCNCVTTTDSKGNSTTVCQTCYDHNYDVDWVVRSNIGSDKIRRIDRQGLKEPQRYSQVIIGEPFAREYGFTNYIKASPTSLFKDSERLIVGYENVMPAYPEVTDYYRINRVISYGVTIDSELSNKLNEHLKSWGPNKQANVITVFVSEKYTDKYFQALKAHWLGGKKNDVIIVSQILDSGNVGWVRVIARSEKKEFDKSVEFDVSNMGRFNTDTFLKIVDDNINQRFEREDFHKYEYLLADFRPSTVAIVIGLVFAFLVNFGMAFFTYKEDVFNER